MRPAVALPVFLGAALAAAVAQAPELHRSTNVEMAPERIAADLSDIDLEAIAAALLLSAEWSFR
jgi:hypothetical protein